MSRHEIYAADLTLLQDLVRVQGVAEQFGVTTQNLALAQFGPRRP